MGRTIAVVLSLLLALSVANAQGKKKKDKEPELAISKRGKLIFEDDFEGKELLWTFKQDACEWKILKGALASKSSGQKSAISVRREFTPVKDAVFEFRLFMPEPCVAELAAGSADLVPFPLIEVTGAAIGTFSLRTWSEETKYVLHAKSPFAYRKPGWINVLYEVVGVRYALTVNGQRITCDLPSGDERQLSHLILIPSKKGSELVAIDDVKVYEALPKDDEPEKDKKKK